MSDHKKLYNIREWRRASIDYRFDNPLCISCKNDGKLQPSDVVDHIIDHKGDLSLFWDKRQLAAIM